MATERSSDVTYSLVPASTFNLKEKILSAFSEEAQYLYQTFITVSSVSLTGTLSISINGNEDIGVIEIAEKTERSPGTSLFVHLQDDQYQSATAYSQNVSGISKMSKPIVPLSPKHKFDKTLFDKITSLRRLELMRKGADSEEETKTSPLPDLDTRNGKDVQRPSSSGDTDTNNDKDDSEELEEDLVEDEDEFEDKEDKKDEDYTPELGEDAPAPDDGEYIDHKKQARTKRRSLRVPKTLKKKILSRTVPKGRKTAAKLSLKKKLKQLTSLKPVAKKPKDKEPDDTPADMACTICHKVFETKRAYKRHCDRHWKTFQCDECGKPFSSLDSLTHHKRGLHSQTKPYSCEECGANFNFHHSYKLHMRKHRGERPYVCDQCHKSYLTATHLKAHKEAIHGEGNKGQFVCDTCGKIFTYRNSLKTHQMIHTGDRPYKCSICQKGFVTRQALKTHEESYHVQERNFQCDICFKFYKSEHLRNVHRRRHTSDVNRFMCDICGRQFMFKSNLEAHSFVHQDDRPFVCTICDKTFKCMSSLYTHQYTHKTTTPFKCSVCNKTFKTKNCCKAHEKRHSAEKNFMCSSCGSCFPDKGGLTKHIRTIHSPVKQFLCMFCGKVGTRADNMRTHIKSHGKEAGDMNPSDCIIEVKPSASGDGQESDKQSETIAEKKEKFKERFGLPKQQTVLPFTQASADDSGGSSGNRAGNYQALHLPSAHGSYTTHVSAPIDQVYQAQIPSPTSTYQPPLSPRNYPQPLSPQRHPSPPQMIQQQHLDVMGQPGHPHSHIQPILTVSDPSQLNILHQPLQHPMPAHLHNHDHGPPVFPTDYHHGQMGNPEERPGDRL